MKRSNFFSVVMVLTVLTGWVGTVSAQCGASLSSCKTCHEVKRAKPVATSGKWHQDHAFGDFCDFCHEGNTAALAKDAAHEGLKTMPLKNAGNTCSSCHPEDFKKRAEKYAKILHVDLAGLSANEKTTSTQEPQNATSSAVVKSGPEQMTKAEPAIAVPTGAEVIDFNEQLNSATGEEHHYGNLILIALIILVFLVFLVMYFTFNRQSIINKMREIKDNKNISEHETASDSSNSATEISAGSELAPLIKKLSDSPVLADALRKIINSGTAGEKVLTTISAIDLQLLESLKKLSDKDLEILRSLAKKM